MLPSAVERILGELGDEDAVLQVGGWAAPLRRADWVLADRAWATRGALGAQGAGRERFTRRRWVQRDLCARAPWPFRDDQFDLAVCAETLETVRDPIWVCAELSRVARRGYVEVPTIEAELIVGAEGGGPWLGGEDHRWLVDVADGVLVFTHKPHSLHHDWRLRVQPRWRDQMEVSDRLIGLFWEGELPARERVLHGAEEWAALRSELAERVRLRFEPSAAELVLKEAREGARRAAGRAAGRALRTFRRD